MFFIRQTKVRGNWVSRYYLAYNIEYVFNGKEVKSLQIFIIQIKSTTAKALMIMQIQSVKSDFNYTHNHVSYTHTHTDYPKSQKTYSNREGKKLLRITDIMKINCRICPQIKNSNIFSWNLFERNYQGLHLYPKTQYLYKRKAVHVLTDAP